MSPVLLSIVVPTRNRDIYVRVLLRSLVKSELGGFEVIVYDNSDADSLQGYVRSLNDCRIVYRHISGQLSVVENFDRALALATGVYVCMIGDDDGILVDESLKVLAAAQKRNICAILPKAPYYAWPGVNHNIWGPLDGVLFREHYVTGGLVDVNCLDEYSRVRKYSGALGLRRLPRVYHGFVKRACLDSMRNDLGTCFPGPSPDMANAVALVKYVSQFAVLDAPVVISGHCVKSTGGQGSEGKHVGEIQSQAHLPADTYATWDRGIPKIWSGPTIYAQSFVLASNSIGMPLAKENEYARLYAVFLVFQPRNWRLLMTTVGDAGMSAGGRMLMLLESVVLIIRRAANLMRNFLYYRNRRKNWLLASDIDEAINVVRREYKQVLKGFA